MIGVFIDGVLELIKTGIAKMYLKSDINVFRILKNLKKKLMTKCM